MAICTHVTVGTNDLAKAREFYDAVLAPLGVKRLKDFGEGGSCWGVTSEEFMVLKPADGKPATVANGGTISFEAPSRAAVAAFHKAALDRGAKDEGAVAFARSLAARICRLLPRSRWQQTRRLLSQGRVTDGWPRQFLKGGLRGRRLVPRPPRAIDCVIARRGKGLEATPRGGNDV